MKATLSATPKPKPKVQATSATPTDSAIFMKLYCAALSGLFAQPFTSFHGDYGAVEMEWPEKCAASKERVALAWNAAIYAAELFSKADQDPDLNEFAKQV